MQSLSAVVAIAFAGALARHPARTIGARLVGAVFLRAVMAVVAYIVLVAEFDVNQPYEEQYGDCNYYPSDNVLYHRWFVVKIDYLFGIPQR